MAQLSRPYQIALGAVAVLGLVWVMALRGHAANPSEPAPTAPPAPSSTAKAVAEAKAAAAPTPVYHGAAPGVEGLTRAIAKAHGAVATSQQNAAQLKRKSSEASGESQASKSAPGGVVASKGAAALGCRHARREGDGEPAARDRRRGARQVGDKDAPARLVF